MGSFKEENLDLILVPCGILIMFIYHLFLIYKYITSCNNTSIDYDSTSIGYENRNKKAWAANMLQLEAKDRGFAVTVLNGQISASTSLTTISLDVCSLIGAILGKSTENLLTSSFIFGDTSKSTNSIKYVAILSCFMLAFACFVQTTRHYAHASFLISTPTAPGLPSVPPKCIQKAVLNGSNFWAVGMRALYFATNLLLWIFGPIPMFVGSVVTVIILYNLDVTKKERIDYGPNIDHKGSYIPEKTQQEKSSDVQVVGQYGNLNSMEHHRV